MTVSRIDSSAAHQPIASVPIGIQVRNLIKAVYQKVIDGLRWLWYALQYALHSLFACCTTSEGVFQGRIICSTTNHARFSDLPKYVSLKRAPLSFESHILKECKKGGFTPVKQTLSPQPFNGGHCFGNVVYFLKKWKETHDIEELSKELRGGSPLAAALYQESYESLYKSMYNEEVSEWIEELITYYPLVSFPQEREKWKTSELPQALEIFDALQVYLQEGRDPKQGDLIEYLRTRLLIGGISLATVRHVAALYQSEDLTERDRMRAAFASAGLHVEHFYHLNSRPHEVLHTLSTLGEGMYKLSLPHYDAMGNFHNFHAVGVVIDAGMCYILDSNGALGWCSSEKLSQTMRRLFKHYTRLEPTDTPPKSYINYHFELLKIS